MIWESRDNFLRNSRLPFVFSIAKIISAGALAIPKINMYKKPPVMEVVADAPATAAYTSPQGISPLKNPKTKKCIRVGYCSTWLYASAVAFFIMAGKRMRAERAGMNASTTITIPAVNEIAC